MTKLSLRILALTLLTASCAFGQSIDPFPQPINTTDGVIREKNPSATRADPRFGLGPDNQVFLLNKQDGTIRMLRP